jgi:hypothetical protein
MLLVTDEDILHEIHYIDIIPDFMHTFLRD